MNCPNGIWTNPRKSDIIIYKCFGKVRTRDPAKEMIANYHTHTLRCGHASMEDEREYVEAAIKAGFSELGFADHTPMPLPIDVDPADCARFMGIRMTMSQTEDYVNKLLTLREEYKNDIRIHIGFEVEYIPATFETLIGFLNTFPTDYIIMGQHFNGVVTDEITYFGAETRSKKVLANYVDLVTEGIKTGKFTYVAHPDLCNFHGPLETYEQEMTRLIETANECNVPLEINLLGINSMRHYPNQVFWTLANEIGCNVVIGSDAHETVGMKPERALAYAEKIVEKNPRLNLLDRVELKPLK